MTLDETCIISQHAQPQSAGWHSADCECPCHSLSDSYDMWKTTALGWELLHSSFSSPNSSLFNEEYQAALASMAALQQHQQEGDSL